MPPSVNIEPDFKVKLLPQPGSWGLEPLNLACKPLPIAQRGPWAGVGRSEHPPKSGRVRIRWCRRWVSYLRAPGPLLSR
jgi:hypothetical protein